MIISKTLFVALFFALFFGLSFFVPKTLAGSYTTGPGCSSGGGPGCSATQTLDTSSVTSVDLTDSGFDDQGSLTITAPSGAVQTLSRTTGCASILAPPQNINSLFADGFGAGKIYTIAVSSTNNCGTLTAAWVILTVTTVSLPSCTLTAAPPSIIPLDSSTLSWTTTNMTIPPDTANIKDGASYNYTVTSASGSTSVSPASSATYTMTVTNGSGSGTCSAPVTVAAPIPPVSAPSCTLIASPPSIIPLDSSTLSWTTTNMTIPPDTANIKDGASYNYTVTSASGSTSVSPASSATYTMTVTGPGGTNTCSAAVAINPPTCTITPSETEIWKGAVIDIAWTSTNATAGTINGTNVTPIGGPTASGSIVTSPININTNFSMNVTGPGGPGTCGPVLVGLNTPPTGGLVPCGRLDIGDDPANIDMSKPCTLCALFYMLKNIINLVMTLAIGIGVFILVVAGLLYALSTGDSRNIDLAKSAVTSAIIGIAIIFIAWMAVAVILQGMGYANMTTWNQVNCAL
ncbi:hypothetical protein KKB43_01470 [Patescibacteria group bacterium]|nr:hypothetical protein [Patescibacteria group bacterium]MBU4579665.1 hypothetical protein [Patescibacteria group bacterium]